MKWFCERNISFKRQKILVKYYNSKFTITIPDIISNKTKAADFKIEAELEK